MDENMTTAPISRHSPPHGKGGVFFRQPKSFRFLHWLLVCCSAMALLLVFAAYNIFPQETLPVLNKDNVIPTSTTAVSRPPTDAAVLKVAIGAMISPKDTEIYYRQLLQYIGNALNIRVELVQRKTYAEINELLTTGDIQLAFICSGPYALSAEQRGFHLLNTPEVQGRPTYRSYLIVHKDSAIASLDDLRGKIFAFTDPDSNTGSLVPRFWLLQRGVTSGDFFKSTIFTYSHDNSMYAVARGLVDGAAVDSLIWDFYAHNKSEIATKTKIIRRSEEYGIPPLVASPAMPLIQRNIIQSLLLHMHENAEGKKILGELLIDRFVLPEDSWYASIREMQQTMHQLEKP